MLFRTLNVAILCNSSDLTPAIVFAELSLSYRMEKSPQISSFQVIWRRVQILVSGFCTFYTRFKSITQILDFWENILAYFSQIPYEE